MLFYPICTDIANGQMVTCRVLEGSLVRGTESGKFSPKLGLARLEMARVQKVHGAVEDVVGKREALMQLQGRVYWDIISSV